MKLPAVAVAVFVVASLGGASLTSAQPPTPSLSADKKKAEQFFNPPDQSHADEGSVQEKMRVIVKYKNPTGKAEAQAAAQSIHHDLNKQNAIAATYRSQAAVEALSRSKNVDYIEMDIKRYMIGDGLRGSSHQDVHHQAKEQQGHRKLQGQSVPYGIAMTQADQVPPGATRKKVCIIDSGYKLGHEDLPSGENVTGYDGSLPWNQDGDGHGSHVAGTIAALNNNVGVVGMMPNNIDLHIVRVFGDDGIWAYSSSLADAVNECVEAESDVINMSLGGGGQSATEKDAFDNAYASGVLPIAAAGNEQNESPGLCSYPASYENVVSVAAIDEQKNIANFSNQNSQVELAAPGVAVLSTVSNPGAEIKTFKVNNADLQGNPFEAFGTASGNLVYCGKAIGTGKPRDRDTGTCANNGASGKVCLIKRGEISFADKAEFCQNQGGVGAIIYNNTPDSYSGTLGGFRGIPVVAVSGDVGGNLLEEINSLAEIEIVASGGEFNSYSSYSGTSMVGKHTYTNILCIQSYRLTYHNISH